MSSEYIWTEVWLVDADIPSYLMQILARADGTYELHDPQKQDVVRRSTDYRALADELSEDEYCRVFGPRHYDPDHDPYFREGAPKPAGAKVQGSLVLNGRNGAVEFDLIADVTAEHIPEREEAMLFRMTPHQAIDLGRALIARGETAKRELTEQD